MNIDDLRDQVRVAIQDSGVPADELLSDNELDQALQRATDRYSLIRQRDRKTTLTTDATLTRQVDISSLVDLHSIHHVEYPDDANYPLDLTPFSLWANTLTLDLLSDPAAGANVVVFWTSGHEPSTVPAMHQPIIVTGGIGYALQELANQKRNQLNVSGDALWGRLSSMATDELDDFKEQLRDLRQLRRGQMYASEAHQRTSTESTDPGPV